MITLTAKSINMSSLVFNNYKKSFNTLKVIKYLAFKIKKLSSVSKINF